jgi:hypothetical protein
VLRALLECLIEGKLDHALLEDTTRKGFDARGRWRNLDMKKQPEEVRADVFPHGDTSRKSGLKPFTLKQLAFKQPNDRDEGYLVYAAEGQLAVIKNPSIVERHNEPIMIKP